MKPSDQLTRKKPLRQFRKKKRPGNRAPTKDEAARIVASKQGFCVPCLVWALMGAMPLEHVCVGVSYDHKKSGNIRIGHGAGHGSCSWHHYGNQRLDPNGPTANRMRERYGPSLLDGSRLFHATYGSDAFLIDVQTEALSLDPDIELRFQDLTRLTDMVRAMEAA